MSIVLRLADIVGALLLIILAALPMAVIAVAIRLGDGGPALFRQIRVGSGGRLFRVLKFRTMRVDASDANTGLPGAEEPGDAARARLSTQAGDSRITRIGRILRPSHLDELPQLFNILAGDMSFVGVRPDTPIQRGDYTPEYWRLRHRYRPGLTGPAQLRSDPLSFAQRSAEELRWVEGRGVWLYFSILARTVLKAIRRTSF